MRAKKEEQKNERSNKIRIVSSPVHTMSPRSSHARKFGYRSKGSLNKEVKKLMKGTPESPVKRRAVIEKLAEEAGFKVLSPNQDTNQADVIKKPNAISKDVIEKVESFFIRTDIVWTSPNLKDEMTVWNEDGSKQKLRKYYLEMTVDEAYGLFKEENPALKIGRTKFFELKPPYVLYTDQFKCVRHERFRKRLAPFKIETECKEFWLHTICDVVDLSSPCWKNECADCKDGKILYQRIHAKKLSLEIAENSKIVWYEERGYSIRNLKKIKMKMTI